MPIQYAIHAQKDRLRGELLVKDEETVAFSEAGYDEHEVEFVER